MKNWCAITLLLFVAETSLAQRAKIDSLEYLVNQHPQDSIGAKTLLFLAVEYSRTDVPKAKKFLQQLISLAKYLEEPKRLSGAYSLLTQLHQNTGLYDSAQYYLNQNMLLQQQFPEDVKININYNNSAGLFYRNQGRYKEALPYLLESLRYSSLANDREAKAGLLLNIGNCYANLGDLVNAADYHLKALSSFEELKNKRGQSFCHQGLGNDFYALKQFNKAEIHFKNSLALKKELNDDRGQISAKLSLGKVYANLSRFQLAAKYLNEANEKASAMKLQLEQARIEYELGLLYKQNNQTEFAKATFLKSLEKAKSAGDSVQAALIESELLSFKNQTTSKAYDETTYLKGIKAAITNGNKAATIQLYNDLAEYYEKTKQYDKALVTLKKYETLNDSIKGNEALIQLKHVEELYLSEKKEKEISLLKKEQELQALTISRQRSNMTVFIITLISFIIISLLLINRYRIMNRATRLLEMERMRNTIARDLHDDLGSTLSSINILSQLALTENNGHTQNYFQRIRDHSSKMMESISDIVWSINPDHDSLEQVLFKIKEFAAEIFEPKNISYSFNGIETIKNIQLNVEQRKNIFLIFKEAINNAAKYSNGSHVEFQVTINDNSVEFLMRDNGSGFDEEHIKFGNGLKNMEARAHDIQGKFELVTYQGSGTRIALEVPIT